MHLVTKWQIYKHKSPNVHFGLSKIILGTYLQN